MPLDRARRPPPSDPPADAAERPVDRRLPGDDDEVAGEDRRQSQRRDDSPFAEHVAAPEAGQVVLRPRSRAERRRVLVDAESAGCEPAGPPRLEHPQREVDVLPVGEQPLVEAADVEEGRAVVGSRLRRGRDRVGCRGEGLDRYAVQVVVDEQRPVELHAGAVDQLRMAPVAENARGHDDPGAGIERFDQSLDEVRVADAVVVEEDQRLARCPAGADVHRDREAGVAIEPDDLGEVVAPAGRPHRPAGRGVVDHDRLVRDRLLRQRVEQAVEPSAHRRLRGNDDRRGPQAAGQMTGSEPPRARGTAGPSRSRTQEAKRPGRP